MFAILCAHCQRPTGAVHAGGDPFLPYIICERCADDHLRCAETPERELPAND